MLTSVTAVSFGVSIHYSLEEQPLGTAGPLTLIPGLDEPFLVMNGDVLTDLDYGQSVPPSSGAGRRCHGGHVFEGGQD